MSNKFLEQILEVCVNRYNVCDVVRELHYAIMANACASEKDKKIAADLWKVYEHKVRLANRRG